jgi:alpha/beta hydrolase fold
MGIERTNSWHNRFRKLLVRYEKKLENYFDLVCLCCCIVIYRRIILGRFLVLIANYVSITRRARVLNTLLVSQLGAQLPDLRGLGDSSKPPTGYDGKATAEDLNQLISQLGFKKILLVAHDIGAQTAFTYAETHPTM